MKHNPYTLDMNTLRLEIINYCRLGSDGSGGPLPSTLGSRAGVDAATMTRIKNGQLADLSATTLLNLAVQMGIDPRILLVRRWDGKQWQGERFIDRIAA